MSDLKGKGPGATLKIKRGKLKGKATGLKVFHRGDICIYIYIPRCEQEETLAGAFTCNRRPDKETRLSRRGAV